MTELEKIVKESHVAWALDYGECIPDEVLEKFAHLVIDWVACQHFEQCHEHRPIQNWILSTKALLNHKLLPGITAKQIEDHKWSTTE
ncbi:hypothetical protein [Polynucleobacter sp. UK-Kesae-W10]|uniref:hypothetical protein n=1 Tax=Polynucleobacter sp. UK-Kesae-W10 TaxID=1819738 RepID=UPI001C0C91A9|nr:hypothetical protein [Polynucleobacter sp. UK-Kesae-W10]MBU3577506.1 hypothetical protein [Polynucleobacter sp. UK-Kesae-W10]